MYNHHNNIITLDQECPTFFEAGTQKTFFYFIFLKVMSYSMAIPLTSCFN